MVALFVTAAGLNVLSRLAAQDAAAISACLLPGIRRELRDVKVRVALRSFYSSMRPTPAAHAMAADMRAGPGPGTMASTLATIVAMNGGKALSASQIVNIANGTSGRSAIRKMQENG